jgi:hypothetical protein
MADYSPPNLDGLVTLANRDGVDIKPTLLRVTTDLYVQKTRHSAEEERHYTELALRLIEAVDAPTRAAVLKTLSAYPAPPAAVMQRLQPRDGERAMPAATQIPTRVRGPAAIELCELFLSADPEERRLILANLQYASLPPAEPIAAATAAAAVGRLETAALSHNTKAFAQELEASLGLSSELALRLIADDSGEPVVIVARALSMPPDMLQRILLCLNPAISQSVLRVYELAQLYDEIEPQAALRLITIWRASHKAAPQRPAAPQPTPRHTATPQRSQRWHVEDRPNLPARPQIRWEDHVVALKAENQ